MNAGDPYQEALAAYRAAADDPQADSGSILHGLMKSILLAMSGGPTAEANMADMASQRGGLVDIASRFGRSAITGVPDARQEATAPDAGTGRVLSAPTAQAMSNAVQPAVAPTPAAPTDPAAFFQQLRQQAGSTAAGGMGGTNFAPVQKTIDDLIASTKNTQYTPPTAPSAVKDFEARRAAAGAAPDSEDDKYNPLQGKRLPQFMTDLGMRMLAGNNGQSFATNIGSSMLGASATAKDTAAKKLAEDKDAWKQKLADAQTLVGLGQTDYGNQSAEAKAQFEAAMKRITAQATGVGENVKLAGEKSADAYRRGMLENTSSKGVAKDRVAQMEQMFQIYKKLTPGVSDKDALKMAVQAIMNPRQDKASEFDTQYQKDLGTRAATGGMSPADIQAMQRGGVLKGYSTDGKAIWDIPTGK